MDHFPRSTQPDPSSQWTGPDSQTGLEGKQTIFLFIFFVECE